MSSAAEPTPATLYATTSDPTSFASFSQQASASPQPSAQSSSSSSGYGRLKRQQVSAACKACHRRKSKCDGARPACSACVQRNIQCHYDVEPEESRMMALKRRNETLEQEVEQLWELYGFLQSRPLSEAQQILERIRSSADLASVLQFVKDGDLLMEMTGRAESATPNPLPQ